MSMTSIFEGVENVRRINDAFVEDIGLLPCYELTELSAEEWNSFAAAVNVVQHCSTALNVVLQKERSFSMGTRRSFSFFPVDGVHIPLHRGVTKRQKER